MKKYAVKLSLSRLEKEKITVDGSFDEGFLDLGNDDFISVKSSVNYNFEAELHASGVVIRGSASVRIGGECGRCLKEVEQDVSTDYTLFIDELGNSDEIDVSEDIREELLLAFPANILCSDDCKGLCPVCGTDLNKKNCPCSNNAPAAPSPWDKLDELGK
ncbi:MAG: DUF177 domain-containing protein [Lentisphaeria bacterium]|nr:DUF177 domain-containing protein [Lentisphaeria bacterium]